MKKSRLSARAQADLVEIRQYSLEESGRSRTKSYIGSIKAVIAGIADKPMRGIACDAVAAGYRRVRSGSHLVYYRIEESGVVIVRILHESMDIDRHL